MMTEVVPRAPLWGLTLPFPGTVLAMLGAVGDDGKFLVEDHCFAGLASQTPTPPLDLDRWAGAGVLGSGPGES